MIPEVGRDVHYFAHGSKNGKYPAGIVRCAKITEVYEPGNPDSMIGICVLNPTGIFFDSPVTRGNEAGQWNWPIWAHPD